jgi:hypothetical protein
MPWIDLKSEIALEMYGLTYRPHETEESFYEWSRERRAKASASSSDYYFRHPELRQKSRERGMAMRLLERQGRPPLKAGRKQIEPSAAQLAQMKALREKKWSHESIAQKMQVGIRMVRRALA